MDEGIRKDDARGLTFAIERLARCTVGVDPSDLPRLGVMLNHLNAIVDQCDGSLQAGVAGLAGGLKVLIEKLILDEIPDRGFAVQAIEIGTSLLLALEKNQGEWPEGIDPWTASIASLLASLGVYAHTAGGQEEEDSIPVQPERGPSNPSDRELCRDFMLEALEHLENIETHLIDLEKNPGDRACIDAIFRPFHSIKGVSGFLDLKQIHQFAHEVETLLDCMRENRAEIKPEVVDLVLSAVDQMKAMVLDLKNSLEADSPLTQWDLTSHLERIRAFRKRLRSRGSPERQTMGGVHGRNDWPIPPPMGPFPDGAKGSEDMPMGGAERGAEDVRISFPQPKSWTSLSLDRKERYEAVKVDTEELARLFGLVRRLELLQSTICKNPGVAGIPDQRLRRDLVRLQEVTAALQKAAASLRMVPAGKTFQKMGRLVRDLSKRSGKNIELHLEGGGLEIDRNVAEALYDPLVHLIRNAVDHGIEAPEERKKAGKPEVGSICLRAFRYNGGIGIEVRDDGRGLDRERILRRAVEAGLVKGGETLTELEIDRLIFHPGLSTSERVTYVSGRGVGMDIVRRVVKTLRGRIEIQSAPRQGSAFRILLPLKSGAGGFRAPRRKRERTSRRAMCRKDPPTGKPVDYRERSSSK